MANEVVQKAGEAFSAPFAALELEVARLSASKAQLETHVAALQGNVAAAAVQLERTQHNAALAHERQRAADAEADRILSKARGEAAAITAAASRQAKEMLDAARARVAAAAAVLAHLQEAEAA
jgi:hypothetical protein